ncbi:hypothetical protein B0H16DRAFT_1462013 [Mycena metata]|uniref:Uncharacterized protein n=1 Tax=Mycena metata TaxID=1033252 RepID=A0AAD7ME03_9AGAR|nr:hypothetical protein B0H16DRAFT_1479095 [Mycena metata]KAJ7747526.1 hypothetical protein B0H16DRAFT_1462013 [Mycena metata]
MDFYGHTPGAGPSNPQPQLTPQQYTMALQMFQSTSHMPLAPPNYFPHPTPFTPPVIDPALLPTNTDDRITALERELAEMKAEKNATSHDQEPASKRRKKSKTTSPYILKDVKNLSKKQTAVRKSLMRLIKLELSTLTGRIHSDSASESESDSGSPSRPSVVPAMSFDFSSNVDAAQNLKILTRAADLIYQEQYDSTKTTFSLPHKNVSFTHADLIEFGKTSFRNWKRVYKAENDDTAAANRRKQASKGRQLMRRKELKQGRLGAVKEYKSKYKRDPSCILETDWMTDEISAPDTDNENKRKAHRNLLTAAAKLDGDTIDDPVWEILHPAFQSIECSKIKRDLDSIKKKAKEERKKRPRVTVRRIDLGNTHSRIPVGTLWPFMVGLDWYKATIEGNRDLEDEFSMYTQNPKGFGDEGYSADNEEE